MNHAPETRLSLILRIRDPQNEQAWAEFAEIYEPLVYRLARGNGFQHADAADLTQDVLVAISSAIERWDPDPECGSFHGWLSRIARNLMINLMVQQRRHPRGSGHSDIKSLLDEVPVEDGEASALFDREYRRELFQWAARQIKPKFQEQTWQAFWRTAVDHEQATRVASDLKISVGSVYVARCRVMARLRKTIEQFQNSISQ